MMAKGYRFETKVLHAGAHVDESCARTVPVHRSSAFVFKNSKHAADLFALRDFGNIYSRIMNPTQDILEKRVAALEGGAAALALASGTSAIFYTVINVCRAGDEVVSATNLYGGTYTQFNNILPDLGIKVRFVDARDPAAVEAAITEKTRLLFTEVIGNPTLDVVSIKALAAVAKKHRIPLAVDSTFTTPYLFRPLEHGANIVIHSLTKWLGGHGAGIGGVVVDGGTFDWTESKFSLYNQADDSYHGVRWAHDLGDLSALAFILRMRLVPLRNLGACISADNAWIFLQGIETLPLRMQRHCDNALAVARYLQQNPAVEWVRYPGLEKDASYAVAREQLENGFGGMVIFGIKGGVAAGERFIDNLKLISHLANVGDARSLAIHPSSTTHSQLSEQQQLEGGITPDLVRLSIGIEHSEDIIADIQQALEAAQKG
jgi:O-acetylhomoserine (thiol)-lyase